MLKLMLMKDDKVLCEIPLSPKDWEEEEFKMQIDRFLENFLRYSQITDALSNVNRLRMLRFLLDEDDMTHNFSDFLKVLRMNPKIVREHAIRLKEAGYVESSGRGKYQISQRGSVLFTTVGLAVMRVIEVLDGEEI
jgi:DNA-binding transcriptional ArsR family regulator